MSAMNEPSCLPLAGASTPINEQPQSGQMVQIPASTLTTLLSSINSLRNDLSKLQKSHSDVSTQLITLQKSHSNVSTQLMTLQQHSGIEFPLFPKLPLELRTMIWRCALTSIPQIHVMGDRRISRSNINSVVESCKEAWIEVQRLRLDYLVLETRTGSVDRPQLNRKNYVNFCIDTFWLHSKDNLGCAVVPGSVTAFCGKCATKQAKGFEKPQDCPRGIKHQFFPIRTLVVHGASWCEPLPYIACGYSGGFHHSDGSFGILWKCQVQELLIIVDEYAYPSPHTVFLEPTHGKSYFYPRNKYVDVALGGHPDDVWSHLESKLVKGLHNYKNQRAINRRKKCEELEITEEELDGCSWYGTRFRSLSTWKIPTVRFVQARSTNPSWMYFSG